MDFSAFLAGTDTARAQRAFEKLCRHGAQSLVLTGSFALELHRTRAGLPTEPRPLNDIDFLAATFDDIPKSLAADFLFSHVHPQDPPGKTLLQAIDTETAVRIDIFHASRGTMARAVPLDIATLAFRVIALEDLAARTARLATDLAFDRPTPAKHARDFLRLLAMVEAEQVEPAWLDHRKPAHPATFREAAALLTELIARRPDLQIIPAYSHDTAAACSRCQSTPRFPLADPARVLSLLGYC
jgi:hypothetical protein